MNPLDVPETLARFASIAMTHVEREYPNKLDHVLNGPHDLRSPRELHPAFFGSFDWHSCVHAHWLIARALRLAPLHRGATSWTAMLDRRLTSANIESECAYLRQPLRSGFERTYGWAWLLKLGAELRLGSRPGPHAPAFSRWSAALAPLCTAFVERYLAYLPKATYPIRVGTHASSAFGIALALDYTAVEPAPDLDALLRRTAQRWFGGDADCQTWEPSGADFLSPALMEAECMRRVLPPGVFPAWLNRFLPGLAAGQPATLFTPATVTDRTDGQIAHLDGLNFSRAWCFRGLCSALSPSDPRRAVLEHAAAAHMEAALPHVSGDYMGEHWLATFAALALTEFWEDAIGNPPKRA